MGTITTNSQDSNIANILIFEDNPQFASELVSACEWFGHTPYEAATIEAVEAIFKHRDIEYAIVDLFVTHNEKFSARGQEVIQFIRRHTNKMPSFCGIILVTGSASFKGTPEDIKLARTLGADDLLRKPVNAIDVISLVNKKLSAKP